MDFSQNIYLPNFGGNQPGDTYYYSPLNIYQFGIVDCSDGSDTLYSYVYSEGDGKKGGNNVVSCLMKNFEEMGYFQAPNYGELTICADNCTGQNKNRMVIWFIIWLVETGHFNKVTLLFFVRGHTKNAADRLFNLLKHGYHNRDIFTFDELLQVLSEHDQVNVRRMKPSNFKNYDKFFSLYYKKPTSGSVTRTHVFTVERGGSDIFLRLKDCAESPERIQLLIKTKKGANLNRRLETLKSLDGLETCVHEGIKPIKQIELWSKWRKHLPEEVQDITCPEPSEEVMKRYKKEKKEKDDAKKQKKKSMVSRDKKEDKIGAENKKEKQTKVMLGKKKAKECQKAKSQRKVAGKKKK